MEITKGRKSKLTKKSVDYTINKDTGEVKITGHHEESIYKDGEDAYIKLYYSVVLATEGVFNKNTTVKFLAAIAPYISWASGIEPTDLELTEDGEPVGQILQLTDFTRKLVARRLHITERRVFQILTELIQSGVLKRISNSVYWVNPFIVGKGQWKDVKTVRMAWVASQNAKQVELLDANDESIEVIEEDSEKFLISQPKEQPMQQTLFGEEIPFKDRV